MSRRLVAGFVLLAVALTAVLGMVRNVNLAAHLRTHDASHAMLEAELLLDLVLAGDASGQPVGAARLEERVGDFQRVTVLRSGELVAVADGPGFDAADAGDGAGAAVRATAGAGEVSVTVTESTAGWRSVLAFEGEALGASLLLAVLAAAAGGWAMARWFSRPFVRLAAAAGMLGRGRVDLDLPRTRIPEVQAVSRALAASAAALQDRMDREQQFSVHASHVLRTPLTSLRLHLDELAARDLDPEAAAAARQCQDSVAELDVVVADLVGISRRGALMSGAEVPLRELAAAVAQQWADGLLDRRRRFSAAVEGDLDQLLTPGPVEYVLDVLLEQARAEGEGAQDVRLLLEGAPPVVRLEVTGVRVPLDARDAEDPAGRLEQARSLVEALGGRMEPLPGGEGVGVLLPLR